MALGSPKMLKFSNFSLRPPIGKFQIVHSIKIGTITVAVLDKE